MSNVIKLTRRQLVRGHEGSMGPGELDVTAKSAGGWAASLAPTWAMVMSYRRGQMPEALFVKGYQDLLYRAFERRAALYVNMLGACSGGSGGSGEVAFLCYCPDGVFCHTHVLIDFIVGWRGDVFMDGRLEDERAYY